MDKNYLSIHAAVRVFQVDGNEKAWIAEHLLDKKKYKLTPFMCGLLCSFYDEQESKEIIEKFKEYTDCSTEVIDGSIQELMRKNLLVSSGNSEHIFAKKIMKKWHQYGWTHAADYHLATFDYPFVDYTEQGYTEDGKRMYQYLSEASDENRSKSYCEYISSITLPSVELSLNQLKNLYHSSSKKADEQLLDKDNLFCLLSVVFGKLRVRVSKRPGQADMIRRTSPSGGSRHPTEAYIIILDVPGLEVGLYHFCIETNSLKKIGNVGEKDLTLLFPGPFRASFKPKVLIAYASLFERNMYRYREPRTFRTLFMDIGHLSATLEITAKSLGLKAYSHRGVWDEEIEKFFSLNGLQEGVMLATALGGREFSNEIEST